MFYLHLVATIWKRTYLHVLEAGWRIDTRIDKKWQIKDIPSFVLYESQLTAR